MLKSLKLNGETGDNRCESIHSEYCLDEIMVKQA